MRVALVTNICSPYRVPVWHELGKQVEALRVFVSAPKEPNRIWTISVPEDSTFECRVLPGKSLFLARQDWGVHWNPSIWRELGDFKPTHIIVTGYETPTYLLTFAYSRLKRIPLVLWWGSHVYSSRVKEGIIASVRKAILKSADAYITYGTLATRFLANIGIDLSAVVTGTNTADTDQLIKGIEMYAQPSVAHEDVVRFLFVGQLIERKGVRELLEAFRHLPKGRAELYIVGYGPLERELRSFAEAHGMVNVKFVGGTRTSYETARYYSMADVLVLPSLREVWGLVINEALAAGLWVLASKYSGAALDLIERAPFDVGTVFDPRDQNSFIRALRVAMDKSKNREMNKIKNWGLRFTAKKYADSILASLDLAGRRMRRS